MVASTFHNSQGTGTVGVIGPTRMRYQKAISVVDGISQVMTQGAGRTVRMTIHGQLIRIQTHPARRRTMPAALRQERDDLQDRLLRSAAEFDNYRKRTDRERRELSDAVAADLIRDLLPVVDDLERALAAAADSPDPALRSGVELIHRQLLEALRRRGAETFDTVGQDFDPAWHEALASEPADGRRDGEITARFAAAIASVAPDPAGAGEGGQGVKQRDYYEVLGVTRERQRSGHQERLSQARAAAPSGSQSRRHGRRREVQGSGRGLLRARRRGQARALRPVRPRRRGRRGRAGPGLQSRHLRRLLRHPRRLLRVRRRQRRGGPTRGSDLRFDLEITFEESFTGAETTIQIPREEHCETCKGSGAATGTTREKCPQCRGTGQLRYQQGFLVVARTCGQCRGTGQVIRTPCATCRGTGLVTKERRVTVSIPAGIADGQRLRLHGEGEHGTAGGPTGDLYVVIHVRPHAVFHREGDDLYIETQVPLPDHGDGRHVHGRRSRR